MQTGTKNSQKTRNSRRRGSGHEGTKKIKIKMVMLIIYCNNYKSNSNMSENIQKKNDKNSNDEGN